MTWAKAKVKRARKLGVQRVSTSEQDEVGSDVRFKGKKFGRQWYTVNSSKLKSGAGGGSWEKVVSQMRTWSIYPHLRMLMVGDSAQWGRLRHRGGARGERTVSELGDEARVQARG